MKEQIVTKTEYVCDFCNAVFDKKEHCEKHEKACEVYWGLFNESNSRKNIKKTSKM